MKLIINEKKKKYYYFIQLRPMIDHAYKYHVHIYGMCTCMRAYNRINYML